MQIVSNISQSKGNQAMKFGQCIEYNRKKFFKNHAKNETGRLGLDLFLFFKETL